MEILDIAPSNNNLWQQVWRLYIDSFPEHERRRVSSHTDACNNEQFQTKIAIENGNLMALIFYWRYGKNIYLEHLAVNPAMRNRNVGSTIITEFLKANPDSNVILEIDPPVCEIAQRRQRFYERLGFVTNNYHYTHPSYSSTGQEHQLIIMSNPQALSQQEFDQFRSYMQQTVLSYID